MGAASRSGKPAAVRTRGCCAVSDRGALISNVDGLYSVPQRTVLALSRRELQLQLLNRENPARCRSSMRRPFRCRQVSGASSFWRLITDVGNLQPLIRNVSFVVD